MFFGAFHISGNTEKLSTKVNKVNDLSKWFPTMRSGPLYECEKEKHKLQNS